MYVLQVMSGEELSVLARLKKAGLCSFVPRQTAIIRRGGEWHEEAEILLPGYVLLDADYNIDTHLAVRAIEGVIRWLGQPTPLPPTEEIYMRWLSNGGEIIAPSEGYMDGGRLVFTSGILAGNEDKIVRCSRRQRRAVLRLTVSGKSVDVTLAVNIS